MHTIICARTKGQGARDGEKKLKLLTLSRLGSIVRSQSAMLGSHSSPLKGLSGVRIVQAALSMTCAS